MRSKVELPNLANYTAVGIVDVCGPDQEELNRLTTLTKYYKVGLKARLDDSHRIAGTDDYLVKGEKYYALIATKTSRRLSQDKVRELLTPEQFESCFVEGSAEYVTFNKVGERESKEAEPQSK